MTPIHGQCDDRLDALRKAFEAGFDERDELGAAVTVMIDGRVVADLWGGAADPAGTRPWERDTLVNVWSTTKGVAALCAHTLADRGLLDLDAPVAAYWPEFAAGGKAAITVRQLMAHRAGLSAPRTPTAQDELYDWDLITARLAASEPWWEPGTRSGYHIFTYGHLVGELVRRIDGRSIGAFLREEITGPRGIDFHIGLPASEDHRVAELVPPPVLGESELAVMFAQADPVAVATLTNPAPRPEQANTLAWRRAEIPSANGHGTARAVARLYGMAAGLDPEAGLSPSAVARARQGQGRCLDLVLGTALNQETETCLGFWLSTDAAYGPNPDAFGHDGFGGSFGLADPENRVSMGYTMNRMGTQIANDPRKKALIQAVYSSL
ncbi:serine hydrolase domain-containing protein [Spirillospora sp. CA-294931]|uniref:serine hydrolase domain-containing protein n=1 Tax=Spirillospora sp. CA-294931 TaxID=3240042 RepID=UPI003D8AB866